MNWMLAAQVFLVMMSYACVVVLFVMMLVAVLKDRS